MDFNLSVVDMYMSMKQQNVAELMAISNFKRTLEDSAETCEQLLDVNNIMTPDHVDVSI